MRDRLREQRADDKAAPRRERRTGTTNRAETTNRATTNRERGLVREAITNRQNRQPQVQQDTNRGRQQGALPSQREPSSQNLRQRSIQQRQQSAQPQRESRPPTNWREQRSTGRIQQQRPGANPRENLIQQRSPDARQRSNRHSTSERGPRRER